MEVNIITGEETQLESSSDGWESQERENAPLPRVRIRRKGRQKLTLKNRAKKTKRKWNDESSKEDTSITEKNGAKK